ncbi:MAG TPA: biotin transporter BioY [Gemmatimonadaceae bacterium]|nr:biotin transporter BioY [Gemmatimonadaceae bacterium]
MTNSTVGSRRASFGVRLTDTRTRLIGVVGFAAALAVASQAAIPLPGTPVPITLQPLLVVLAGLWLGPTAAAASMALYLVAGAAGLPVFAPIGAPGVLRLLGPTGGYLLAYPVAAWVAGRLSDRATSFAARAGAAAAGILVLYVGGLSQLTIITGSLQRAALLGVLPFAALDAVKALVAALVSPSRGRRAAA